MSRRLITIILLASTVTIPAAWIGFHAVFSSCSNTDCIGPGIIFVVLLFTALAALVLSGVFFLMARVFNNSLFGTLGRVILGFGILSMLGLIAYYAFNR